MKRMNNDTRAHETVAPATREIRILIPRDPCAGTPTAGEVIKLVLQACALLEAAEELAYLRRDHSAGDALCDARIDVADIARSYLPPAIKDDARDTSGTEHGCYGCGNMEPDWERYCSRCH